MRWRSIHRQITRQRYGNFSYNYSNASQPSKASGKTMLILDMDETTSSVRDFKFQNDANVNYTMIRYYNQKELIFNVFERLSLKIFTIYAPGLMSLIWSTQHSMNHKQVIDIGIYTQAMDDRAIYHAVFIEIYYNYIFQMKYYPQHQTYFEFKFVISRNPFVRKVNQKSLKTVLILVPNLKRIYSNIVIVDDQSCHNWSKRIPQQLRKNTDRVRIAAFKAQQFLLFSLKSKLSLSDEELFEKILGGLPKFDFLKILKDELKSPNLFRVYENNRYTVWRDLELKRHLR